MVKAADGDSEVVLYEVRRATAWLTLNRPEKRNPLSPAMIGGLSQTLDRAKSDPEVRAVVLTGAGKVFSAGGDLSAMGGSPTGKTGGGAIAGTLPDLFLQMSRLGKPIIAMVNGHALAGGLGLMVACDLAIATDEAEYGTPEINVGLWPMMIMALIFRNVPRKRGLELLLTGERIRAEEAERLGLINRAVPPDRLLDEVESLCEKIAQKSPKVMDLGMRAFHEAQDLPLEAQLKFLQERFLEVLGTDDAREGLTAFIEKRSPVWTGR